MQNLEVLNLQTISLEEAMFIDGGNWGGNWFERLVDAFVDELIQE